MVGVDDLGLKSFGGGSKYAGTIVLIGQARKVCSPSPYIRSPTAGLWLMYSGLLSLRITPGFPRHFMQDTLDW